MTKSTQQTRWEGKYAPNPKLLSIIIPAYQAEGFIEDSLLQVKSVMDYSHYDYEIICVVDGKSDKTFSLAKKVSKKFPKKIKVIGYRNNLGKGHAVRFGMAKSKGDVIGFIDAGFDLNPQGLEMLLSHFIWYDADVVVGSKRHPASKVNYPFFRKLMSIGYQYLVRVLFGLKIKDTQVGMKFFKREVLEKTLPRLLVKTFAFDVEMLAVARYLGYIKIYEAPVEMKMDFRESTIVSKGFVGTIYKMIVDTLAVYYRLNILDYYNYKNRKKWITPEYLTLKSG